MNKIRFCVARPLSKDNPDNISLYHFGDSGIRLGNIQQARNFLKYCNEFSPPEEDELPWGIYQVNFTLLEN